MSESSPLMPEQYLAGLDSSSVWTIRYLDASGFEVQLSLEASTGVEVMRKGQLVIERLKEMQCSPVVRNNPALMVKEQDKDNDLTCPIHHIPLKLYQKNGRSWRAHRTETGEWCKGVK